METKSTFWWLKTTPKDNKTTSTTAPPPSAATVPKLDLDISTSLVEFLEKEQNLLNSNRTVDDNDDDNNSDIDVGSIIDEINRVAAQSPLGPYELTNEERSIDEIMKEAARIYEESSRNFEQLSQRSNRTSQHITDINSKNSTPTPKSISPLPTDDDNNNNNDNSIKTNTPDNNNESSSSSSSSSSSESEDTYSDDFSVESRIQSIQSLDQPQIKISDDSGSVVDEVIDNEIRSNETDKGIKERNQEVVEEEEDEIKDQIGGETAKFNKELVATLEQENRRLREEIRVIKIDLQQTTELLDQTKMNLMSKSLCSPEINQELERTLEELKDAKEINTALQLQLDTINKTHFDLKNTYEDLLNTNQVSERRVYELETTLEKYKNELINLQKQRDKFIENETNLNKLLDIEKLQCKSLKLQNDKDIKSIKDLNRQIKEMERIIARKHPDSVSALIVAAKNNDDTIINKNSTARKLLEDRIRILEEEATQRDQQSAKIFVDIQEKFNQMKSKYENHIDDLELHVNDLKQQLKTKKIDTFDVYTQTTITEQQQQQRRQQKQQIAEKGTTTIGVQTDQKIFKKNEIKQETHLIQTIRGLQNDLTNKEKVIMKLQREIDELKKTIRKLQKEREHSLRNLNERREFRSYPEKLSQQSHATTSNNNHGNNNNNNSNNSNSKSSIIDDDEVRVLRAEKDKMKQQLCRIEEDYQTLKTKRLHDLNALQEAHEREIADYVKNIDPLREQLELQQVQISTLENQLKSTKEELLIVHVEREHLNQQLKQLIEQKSNTCYKNYESEEIESLQKKIEFLEKRYEEREIRLRSIVQGLVQKTNQSCEQCAERQRQLIAYKIELDQLLATLRVLKS